MTTKTIYNEQTKLMASLVNLGAVGLVSAGVTAPLVSAFYGAQLGINAPLSFLVFGGFFWLVMAGVVHAAALFLLRGLIE